MLKRRDINEKDISTEKASQKQRAWLQKKNVGFKRPQGVGSQKSERQKEPYCLRTEIILSKVTTLNRNCDFRRIYNRGKSYADPALVLYLNKNRAGICRIGITSSKKIGNAVQRNRSRRLIRAAFYSVYDKHNAALQGYDLVLVARTKTRNLKSTDLENTLEKLLNKAGVIG